MVPNYFDTGIPETESFPCVNPRFRPPPEMSSPVSITGANSDPPESDTEQQAEISMIDRAPTCNVHIYDANALDMVLGGLILTNGVTTANFYFCLIVLLRWP